MDSLCDHGNRLSSEGQSRHLLSYEAAAPKYLARYVRTFIFYTILDPLLLTVPSDERTKQNVVLKSAPDFLLRKEREILNRFQNTRSLRRLIDDVQDPPLLVLEYLDTSLLAESTKEKLESSDVKRVAKTVLQALAALHEEGIVHTGA